MHLTAFVISIWKSFANCTFGRRINQAGHRELLLKWPTSTIFRSWSLACWNWNEIERIFECNITLGNWILSLFYNNNYELLLSLMLCYTYLNNNSSNIKSLIKEYYCFFFWLFISLLEFLLKKKSIVTESYSTQSFLIYQQ